VSEWEQNMARSVEKWGPKTETRLRMVAIPVNNGDVEDAFAEVAALRAEVERLTRERDEARAVLAGFLDEPCKDCLGYEAKIGLLESHVREACAALDHFQGLASAAFRECIGREMEIAAARALHSFWREVGVDE